jgi:hypothetical protein
MDEIINKVATSKLEVFDLEDHYPKGIRSQVDIWLWHWKAFIKGKEFREHLKTTIDSVPRSICGCQLQHRCYCPGVGFHISYNSTSPFTKIVDGNIDDLNAALYEELLAKIDFSAYVNKSIIIKAVRKAGSYTCLYWPHNIYNPMPVLCMAKLTSRSVIQSKKK